MLNTVKGVFMGIFALALATTSPGQSSASNSSASKANDRRSVTIVFEDGRRQTFPLADIARIEFKDRAEIIFKDGHQQSFGLTEAARIEFSASALSAAPFGRNHFLGKWRVGIGTGGHFFITLKPDGEARKTLGSAHGTWTVVDGEARISWNDGWHDAIRKVGAKHEKVAYEPGKTFSDEPTNVADATRVDAEPI
jgi:hypothetical protein